MQLSDMPREKISCKFSPNFFFFDLKKMQYGKDIICKARSNLMMPIQKKQLLDLLFLSSPKSTCNALSRE
jgi:hypothetical protein